MARPTKYNEKVSTEICQRLAEGESLEHICKDKHMPSTCNVRVWKNKYEEFQANYARAREEQGTYYANKVVDIADKVLNETYAPDRGRVAIDAYKWTAGKLNGAYSDKQIIESKNTNVNIDTGDMSDAELLKIIKG